MTYKLVLSIFPLIIFAFAFVGFLRIDEAAVAAFVESFTGALPPDVMEIFDKFVTEVIGTRSAALLSVSIIAALYSSSSGFASIIKGINTCYGRRDTRSWIRRRVLSILLVLLFVAIVALAMGFMVLSNVLWRFALSVFAIFVIVVMIYKVGSCIKVSVRGVLPGACITVTGWSVFSWLFNIYVRSFANFTVIYGSLGSIFIMLIWLNCITMVLLAGAEVNAHLTGTEKIKKHAPQKH